MLETGVVVFFFHDTATTEIYTLSLHDALPISKQYRVYGMTEFSQIVAVVAAGFACGFINTLAGSGSLITLPLLIFLGLPAPVANGTNRVAIVIQNVVAVTSFRAQKVLDVKPAVRYAVPAVFGAIVGARIAVGVDAVQMERDRKSTRLNSSHW